MARLLAESGETVHVIGQQWKGAEKEVEALDEGKLIIHRIPFVDWKSAVRKKIHSGVKSKEAKYLFKSDFPPQCFSYQASLLAERLIEEEGIEVIEAQDFEAPLYFLQLRRTLGLGPDRRPPCIVHLHSPMEFIVKFNDWDIYNPYFLTAKRLEDYSIAAADALICPSQYLAHQAENHYGLAHNSIKVIAHPIGNMSLIRRDKETWEQGSVCYVGRLERRKGIIEWINAALEVAPRFPSVQFEFIGENVLGTDKMGGEEFLRRMIPKDMKSRFHFRGYQDRTSLLGFLAKARIAVIPSRWENFPYTCIEAMGTGLPVIASPRGGMVEMIEDGRTGWLAKDATSRGLAEALERALKTPTDEIAEMGQRASREIKRICDNKNNVGKHLRFRAQIKKKGAERSSHLPLNLPWAEVPISAESSRKSPKMEKKDNLAIVISCFNDGRFLGKCLQRIKQQISKPSAVMIVDEGSTKKQTLKALERASKEGWQVVYREDNQMASAKNMAIQEIIKTGMNPVGFAFLSPENQVHPDFIFECVLVLQRCPEVGVVSCWSKHPKSDTQVWIKPCPSFPYQWVTNEAVPFSAVRLEALVEAGHFRPQMSQGYEKWDLFNAVMAAGWAAVTFPAILVEDSGWKNSMWHVIDAQTFGGMRRELLARFPELIKRDAQDIIFLTEYNRSQSRYGPLLMSLKRLAVVSLMPNLPKSKVLRILGKILYKFLNYSPSWISHFVSKLIYRF
ncbi:hypothetical protein AC481_00870 [miscellaneous Crenarchaeota group archaeon SMTZ-80]|nr:MAG: hypothetical protein AC481_00870 [miscellaneous Crenarchaeota group archaeon SMTZ-80]